MLRSALSIYLGITLAPLVNGFAGTLVSIAGAETIANGLFSIPFVAFSSVVLSLVLLVLSAKERESAWAEPGDAFFKASTTQKGIVGFGTVMFAGVVFWCALIGSFSSLYSSYEWFALHVLPDHLNGDLAREWEKAILFVPLMSALPASLYGAVRIGMSGTLMLSHANGPSVRTLPFSAFLVVLVATPGLAATIFDVVALTLLH